MGSERLIENSNPEVLNVRIKHNPYLDKTEMWINNEEIEQDDALFQNRYPDHFKEWVGALPIGLHKEFHANVLNITFCGLQKDKRILQRAFKAAQSKNIIEKAIIHYQSAILYDEFIEKSANLFLKLRKSMLIDDPDNQKLIKEYEKIRHPYFKIEVVSTMSSGKSTLINAMMGRQLLPSQNEACTATIFEILDTDAGTSNITAYDYEGKIIKNYHHDKGENIDLLELSELNDSDTVSRIRIDADIPFLKADGVALMLVDTPGANNSQNILHKEITYKEIQESTDSIIIYVLNGSQLGTTDDHMLLKDVSEQMKKGGKQLHDRFLFVVNKMDQFDPEQEEISNVLNHARAYIESFGIENPLIFPCSAETALNIRTTLKDIDIEHLSRQEEKRLSSSARDGLSMIDKLTTYEDLYLEKYSSVSISVQHEIEQLEEAARDAGDTKSEALIHSGIISLEKYISLYMKKQTVKKLSQFLNETVDNFVI